RHAVRTVPPGYIHGVSTAESTILSRIARGAYRSGAGYARRNRKQQIGFAAAAEMKRGAAVEHVGRPIDRIIVHERSAAGHRVLHVGETRRRPGMLVILAADAQSDAIAGRNHDRGRPDLDVELDDLTGFQRLVLVVSVIGAIGRRELPIELAVR